MPLQATSGAASYDAFGGGVAAVPNYIEDVFSTWLYTGSGSTQTINNGIDLAGKGGLVWIKDRGNIDSHRLHNTVAGANRWLRSNGNDSQFTESPNNGLTSFNNNGFSVGNDSGWNGNTKSFASWTFREQPKFFDVVTWTGNSVNGRQIAHNLGSAPGCIIVKNLTNSDEWLVWHRSLGDFAGSGNNLVLNTTASEDTGGYFGVASSQTSTYFTVNANVTKMNWSGNNYVAYLFAHNAGGFGLTGTDNVISCGSFTQAAGVANVNLGYEPQWVLIKRTDTADNWTILDNMRGVYSSVNTPSNALFPNTSGAESSGFYIGINATGFDASGLSSWGSYIYIAIRRGPMRTPTTGTSVFVPYAYAGSGAGTYTTGINQDLFFAKSRNSGSYVWNWYDRLRGPNLRLQSNATNAESSVTGVTAFNNTSMTFGASDGFSSASPFGGPYIGYALTRAPGFFDEVCYTGNGSNPRTINHNLGVAPELMIVKRRNVAEDWSVYCAYMSSPQSSVLFLNLTDAQDSGTGRWNNTAPTSTVFSLAGLNTNGGTYVAYLFASCPGVSKVGSYTGNGSSQTINMGFAGGARFFLVKRTDSTGDWWVYDSARGIVSAADPALRLNSTAAEVTSADAVDTDSTGLIVNQESTCNINVSSATYIYLGIS